METRLRLILGQIHWSLALKAVILGFVWLFLPIWAFLVLSLYFYFVPVFHPWKLFLPFAIFLFLAWNAPVGAGFAIIVAALFYAILGTKDLILIDRKSAYDTLVLSLALLLYIWLFSAFGDSMGYQGLVAALFTSAVLCFLYGESLLYSHPEWERAGREGKVRVALGLTWLIIIEITTATIFLPVNFLYQSAISFFPSTILFGMVSAHLEDGVSRRNVLVGFCSIFVFLVIVLGSASWGV